ncbi:restriction endonuclease subunit S [Buttiauxella sp. S04-F03]|uniref:restriction endonuclease subunit S n=1 Tax=Buttiauxella sp. S04-F03 TaxID=2904525 RepID=UPI001E607DEE|nr:restriction endonuclease subunit S [Buttiauxella sp. S04-F03]MCE0813546.1 restriction endonuclease subunit S [Buttiauxella sp. S04-F03]
MSMDSKVPEIRFKGFSTNWLNFNLSQITDVYDGTHQTPAYTKSGVMFLSAENIKSLTSTKFISEEAFKREFKVYPKKNDVLMTRIGDVGTANVVETDDDRAYYVTLALLKYKKISPYFLKSSIASPFVQKDIWLRTLHIAFPKKINMNEIKKVVVNCPPDVVESDKIGQYFKNLDALITQHQQKHDKLSSIKKAMLEKMFPQQGETIPEIRFKGFSGEWERKKLGEIGDTFTGLSGKTKDDFGHGQGRFVTYLNVFSNAISNENSVEPIEIDTNQNEVKKGDVFFTTSSETPEEVGMSSIWMSEIKNVYLNSFCFGYRPKQKFDNYYLAYMFRSNSFREKVVFLAQGISRYNISKTKVMDIKISIPNLTEQEKIGNYFQNLDTLINKHQEQIAKLNNIKQACLSKMFV